jgi:hypothetical protein
LIYSPPDTPKGLGRGFVFMVPPGEGPGLLPNDLDLLGQMVEDISFNNARNYFPMECD